MEVSRSAYYDFVNGRSWRLSPDQQMLKQEVQAIFEQHQRRYGSRRIHAELRSRGFEVGRHRVRSLMKRQSLKAIQPRSFVPKTTQTDPLKARSPNLLLEKEPLCSRIREVIVGDITYWPAASRWLYLSVWMDLFSRRILGWKVEDHMRAELVTKAFTQLPGQPGNIRGAIVHTDGGSQYKSGDLRKLLRLP